MGKQRKAAQGNQGDFPVCHAPERARQAKLPLVGQEEQANLKAAEYRLGVKKFGRNYVETLLFLRAGGLEIGYYTIHFDLDGCFVDFTSYDEEEEVRAVYERFAVLDDGKETLTGALERDLRAMGYYIPQLCTELTDLRLTCESSAGCGCAECRMDCPLQAKFRPGSDTV